MKKEKTFKERLLQFFRIKPKQETLESNKKDNEEPSDLRKMLAQIKNPYEGTEPCDFRERCRRFERYQDKPSVFLDTEVSCVPKYEYASIKKRQGKEPEGH